MIFIGASAVAVYWLAASTIFWGMVLFDGEEPKREAEIIPFPKGRRQR